MNVRSLSFRLSAWYAGVCAVVCLALAVSTYLWLSNHLTALLSQTLERRADQIAALWRLHGDDENKGTVINEIKVTYAPEQNERFIRISEEGKRALYISGPPTDSRFDPEKIPLAQIGPKEPSATRKIRSQNMLVVGRRVTVGPTKYIIEYGASLEPIESVLHAYLTMLCIGTPLVLAIAVAGGILLVRKSLDPVREITAAARDITYRNLRNRLPVAATGDELERLSVVLNEMIERLEAAFQHSQRFTALASHELRTPLTIVIGDLEAILRNPALDPDTRSKIASVYEEAERLAKITESLLYITRLEAGEALASPAQIDLSRLVESTCEQMALLAEEKNQSVCCEIEPGVETLGDKGRIKQVVVNLLDNAIKYSPARGEIVLRVKHSGSSAIFTVEDTGYGIAEEALPHVFESFFRATDSRTWMQEGTGLGLSIVKSICTAHGGTVEIANRPSGGCVATATFPLKKS